MTFLEKDPSSSHPSEAHPLSCCAHTSLHHWKPVACGSAELMEGLTFSSLGRKARFVQTMPVLQMPHAAGLTGTERSIEENCSFLFALRVRRGVELVSLFPALFAQAITQKFPSHRKPCYPHHTCSEAAHESRFPLTQKPCRDIWQ